MSIGKKIKNTRKERKLTQKKLAELLNKSERTIQAYEGDKIVPPYDVLKDICSILNLRLNDLFSEITYTSMHEYDSTSLNETLNSALIDQLESMKSKESLEEMKRNKENEISDSLSNIWFYLFPDEKGSLEKNILLDVYRDPDFKECLSYLKKKHTLKHKISKDKLLNSLGDDHINGSKEK